jgi:phage tail protein X
MSDPVLRPGRPVRGDLVAEARACLSGGGTLDQVAKAVLARTTSPIDAILALREALPGLSLADAKPIVHRNLPPRAQRAAEQLWDDLEQAAREVIEQQTADVPDDPPEPA